MDRVIHQSRILPCSVTQAFACFTQNALLTRWLTGDANVRAETGGAYELFWQPDVRENNSTILFLVFPKLGKKARENYEKLRRNRKK